MNQPIFCPGPIGRVFCGVWPDIRRNGCAPGRSDIAPSLPPQRAEWPSEVCTVQRVILNEEYIELYLRSTVQYCILQ